MQAQQCKRDEASWQANIRRQMQAYQAELQQEMAELEEESNRLEWPNHLSCWMFWTSKNKERAKLQSELDCKQKKLALVQAALGEEHTLAAMLQILNKPAFFQHFYCTWFNFLGCNSFTRGAQLFRTLRSFLRDKQVHYTKYFDQTFQSNWQQQFAALEKIWVSRIKQAIRGRCFSKQQNKYCDLAKITHQQKTILQHQVREIQRLLNQLKMQWYEEFKKDFSPSQRDAIGREMQSRLALVQENITQYEIKKFDAAEIQSCITAISCRRPVAAA